jgi:hypothetical protein
MYMQFLLGDIITAYDDTIPLDWLLGSLRLPVAGDAAEAEFLNLFHVAAL